MNDINPIGDDAKAIMAFGKSAQVDATNAAMDEYGPTARGPAKPDEGADGFPGRLDTVYNGMVRRANAAAQRMLRGGTAMYRGGESIGDVAKSAVPPAPAPQVQTAMEPAYARGGRYGGGRQPYIDVGGRRVYLGGMDANDPKAVAAARRMAEEDDAWIRDNGGYAKTDFS